ncbi:hypothetical protein ACTXT7_013713 [Hymenolepis weldensis]
MYSNHRLPLFPTNTNQQILPGSTQNQNIKYPVPAFPVMYTTIPTSGQRLIFHHVVASESISAVQRMPTQLSERERNRKDKKKYLERQRRAKINSKIKTTYDFIFKMSGEKIRKTEMCKMLSDSLTVIKSLYKNAMEDPTLKARVLPPGLLSSESKRINGRIKDAAFSPLREEEMENLPPASNKSPLSPVCVNPIFIQATSTPAERRGRKRESADSGLEQSQSSASSNIPNSSSSSQQSASSKKSRITPYPQIWRPYQE